MAIDSETHRLMTNWARWKSGPAIGLAVTGAYDLEARGRREEVPLPLMNGEASDVEEAFSQLPEELGAVVFQYWLGQGTTERKARAARCSPATFWRRLEYGHARIHAYLKALRDRSERMRRAYSGRHD